MTEEPIVHDFWTQPAKLFVVQEVAGGPPRKRTDHMGPLNWLIELAINDNPVPLDQLEIRTDHGSEEFGPNEIRALASDPDRPEPIR